MDALCPTCGRKVSTTNIYSHNDDVSYKFTCDFCTMEFSVNVDSRMSHRAALIGKLKEA